MWLWWVVGVTYALLLSVLYVPVWRRLKGDCIRCSRGAYCLDEHAMWALFLLAGLPLTVVPFLMLHRPTRRDRELARAEHDLALAKVRDEEDRLLSEQLARLSRERES